MDHVLPILAREDGVSRVGRLDDIVPVATQNAARDQTHLIVVFHEQDGLRASEPRDDGRFLRLHNENVEAPR